MYSDNTGATEETSATVLAQETSAQKIPPCYMLEVYGETTIFIRVNITENVIKSVPWKRLGGSVPDGMNSQAL